MVWCWYMNDMNVECQWHTWASMEFYGLFIEIDLEYQDK